MIKKYSIFVLLAAICAFFSLSIYSMIYSYNTQERIAGLVEVDCVNLTAESCANFIRSGLPLEDYILSLDEE
jgi:hypothetical protein